MRRMLACALFLGVVTAPALAAEQMAEPPALETLFSVLIREDDVTSLFAYLRSALIAASEGRGEAVPEALKQRAEALGADLKLRGTLASLILLKELEARTKSLLGERAPPR